MAGFENDVVFALNGDFTQADNQTPVEANGLVTNGDLWIGSTALNAGSTHINVGNIISTSLTVNYSSPDITIETNGGGSPIEQITIDNSTGAGTNPVLPDGSGNFTITGAQQVNASLPNVIQTHSFAANSFAITIQRAAAAIAADTTQNGVSHFDSTDFTVAASGFVELSATGAAKTITGDSGGALSPAANNWNIVGLSGSKTSGAASTLTIKSPPFSQVGGSATSSLNTGEFVTAAVTRTLPVSAGLADGDLFIYVATTAGALIIQSVAAQKIRLGNTITAAAGTATSTAIGDSLTLRFNATDGFFYAVSSIGNWTLV